MSTLNHQQTDFIAMVQTPQMQAQIRQAVEFLSGVCHGLAAQCGWWSNLQTGESLESKAGEPPRVNVAEKLLLVHTEVSEAAEAFRKDANDDKLPHRKGMPVELGDASIRIFDMDGGMELDLAGAIIEKLVYNATRADHKLENRRKAGGKSF